MSGSSALYGAQITLTEPLIGAHTTAHIGTYALVALDAQIAGSVLQLTAGCRVVLCGSGPSTTAPERAIGCGERRETPAHDCDARRADRCASSGWLCAPSGRTFGVRRERVESSCRVSSRAGASGSTTEALPTTRREARRRMFHRLPKGVGAEPMTATKDHPCPVRWRGADRVAALGEGGGRCR
jgi:hypothetical protein